MVAALYGGRKARHCAACQPGMRGGSMQVRIAYSARRPAQKTPLPPAPTLPRAPDVVDVDVTGAARTRALARGIDAPAGRLAIGRGLAAPTAVAAAAGGGAVAGRRFFRLPALVLARPVDDGERVLLWVLAVDHDAGARLAADARAALMAREHLVGGRAMSSQRLP